MKTDGGVTSSAVHRVAWMMRVNRLYGLDEALVNGVCFAQSFTALSPDRAADRAQISRWERGTNPAGHGVLRTYEQLLDMTPGRLTATADSIHMNVHNGGPRSLPRSREHRPCAELLDKALGSAVMTGVEWDTLATRLASTRSHRQQPSRQEHTMAQRLVTEMTIADNLDWRLRLSAIHALMRTPLLEAAVIGACADIAADATSQVVIEPLTLLESSANREAALHIIGFLVEPASPRTLEAAWWAAAEKMTRSHFSTRQMTTLLDHATEILVDESPAPLRMAAASVAASATHRAPSLIPQAALSRALRTDVMAGNIFAVHQTASREQADSTADQVTWSALSRMPRDVLSHDPILSKLISEMLFHPHISRRMTAIHTIEATPYRLPVAAALIDELLFKAVRSQSDFLIPLVQAIGGLAGALHRPVIERLAADPATPDRLFRTALGALAHMAGLSSDAWWSAMLTRSCDKLVYAAGVHRKTAILRRVKNDPASSAEVRASAAWWLDLPSTILASTTRTDHRMFR